jgi:hypothetical protein
VALWEWPAGERLINVTLTVHESGVLVKEASLLLTRLPSRIIARVPVCDPEAEGYITSYTFVPGA